VSDLPGVLGFPEVAEFDMRTDGAEIRPARLEDIAELWPLVEQFAFSYRPERSTFERSFRELLERFDTLVLVAEIPGPIIVGYLLASYHGTFFANGPVAWIEELMVDESVRRQGVASGLMDSAETWAKSIPTAYVAVASRRAGDFYLKIGYEESATYFRKTFTPARA
jgi:GNAT superfamily N-acetyltransferase